MFLLATQSRLMQQEIRFYYLALTAHYNLLILSAFHKNCQKILCRSNQLSRVIELLIDFLEARKCK